MGTADNQYAYAMQQLFPFHFTVYDIYCLMWLSE